MASASEESGEPTTSKPKESNQKDELDDGISDQNRLKMYGRMFLTEEGAKEEQARREKMRELYERATLGLDPSAARALNEITVKEGLETQRIMHRLSKYDLKSMSEDTGKIYHDKK